ncbi:hypothetical protein FEM48_Zijuj10G0075000 [Ziziphus jujuba var. spinosa]|uniref:non-specific serine/threonine protein kinase n=1 Tax=Ziziphus jujuba var. spinosa TaxID=714518 RepID=A0A978UM43_ZIZJJ|nr:hypothetical protein FEM48_Zijuj10G0075000 [Ziziphus jujuba var. spinosa]
MENFWVFSRCFFSALILALLSPMSMGQLTPSENRLLFRVQKLLEYPEVLQGWNNWTNFCYLPSSPSLKIVCSNNRISELTIIGNKSSPSHIQKPVSRKFEVYQETLSENFSIDSLFTVVTKLSNLKVLSLMFLGLWGPLPAKINRFWSLQVLNISSNFIYGEIPPSIASMKTLKSLVLADNLFNGSVPDLKSLTVLEELNLGYNHLGPQFPSLGNTLVSIILTNNSLRSEIPSKLTKFDKLQHFDISVNKFVGPIPPSLFSMPSIQHLNLAQNQLSGALPMNITCSVKLKFIDISHNLLIGKLPSCIGSKSLNRTVFYSWNCLSNQNIKSQHPYSFCHREALAVKPPAKTLKKESSIKLSLVLGIIGGVAGVAAVLGLLVLVILRRKNLRRAENNNFDRSLADKMSVRSSTRPNIDARRVPQTARLPATGLPPYRVFTLEEIDDLTNNFDPSNLVGEGSQGKLYKGWLRDGSAVLVKCSKLKQKHVSQSLMQSMDTTLSKLRHRHLVSVLGHCIVTYQDSHPNAATSTVFIVLEHITNGSLKDYLTDWRKKEMLKWPQRMAITIGFARGVQFLHTGVAPGIFGNNLKIENVLLDNSLSAKISDYNILLPFKIGSESPLNGKGGHLDSAENGEKEDIYQVGIILLEVLMGKLANSTRELEEMKLELERGLTEGQSKLRSVIDSSIQGSYAYQSLKTAVEITITCLSRDSNRRPSIEDVLWHLQYSIQVQEGWTSSGNLSAQM